MRAVEVHPWRAIGYMIYAVQFAYMLLDLAVGEGVDISWHNAVTTIEFLSAVFLASYQAIRISATLQRSNEAKDNEDGAEAPSSPEPGAALRKQSRRCLLLLSISLLLQIVIAILNACSFSRDREVIEWTVFPIAVVWSIVNAWSYCAVQAFESSSEPLTSSGVPTGDFNLTEMSPLGAVAEAYRSAWRSFVPQSEIRRRRSWMCAAPGTMGLLALSYAVLVSIQGVLVDWLLEASSSIAGAQDWSAASGAQPGSDGLSGTGDAASADATCACRVTRYAYGLVAAWFAAAACRALLQAAGSSAVLRLELWLRDRAFAVRARWAAGEAHAARLRRVYEVDIGEVVGLASALVEILARLLLVVSVLGALVALNWKVAVSSLSLVSVVAVVSGAPPAGTSSTEKLSAGADDEASARIGIGSALLRDGGGRGRDAALRVRHRVNVTIPLRASWLRRTAYSDAAVDLFVGAFGSFLTISVVIGMGFDVAERATSPGRCVAVLFLFVSLLRAATRLPALGRRVASRSGSLRRVTLTLLSSRGGTRKQLDSVVVPETAKEVESPPTFAGIERGMDQSRGGGNL